MNDSNHSSRPSDHSTDVHNSDTVAERRSDVPSVFSDLTSELLRSPELVHMRSLVIDRAVAEFQSLTLHDPSITAKDYSRRFAQFGSSLQSSIARELEVEQYIQRHPWLSDGRAQEWPKPGDLIGQFEVVEELGRGGLARVYLCRQRGVGNRQVVVKLGRSALLEAHTLGQLRHPNIVPVHSAEMEPQTGMAMLCMPFLGRSTLHDLVEVRSERQGTAATDFLLTAAQRWHHPADQFVEEAPSVARRRFAEYHECVAYVGARIAGALSHAHRQGVVHGDVKPSNVLLSHDGEPLLVDFNLSGNADLAIAARGGTLPYMPPEQLHLVLGDGLGAPYDERSDVYSLGAVLFELLTGRAPYSTVGECREQADLATDLLHQQVAGCPPLRGIDPTIPPTLASVVERCLEFDPGDRFASAEDARFSLQRELRPSARWRRWIASRKAPLARWAALALMMTAAAAAYLFSRPPLHVRLFDRGVQLRRAGEMQDAERHFAEAVTAAPDFLSARFELAVTLLRQKKLNEALDEFHQLASVDENPRNLAYMGYCFSAQEKHTVALAWYRRFEDRGGESPEVHNNLAVSYELGNSEFSQAERLQRTKRHLTRALRELPASPAVRLNWVLHELRAAQLGAAAPSTQSIALAVSLANEFPTNDVANASAAALIPMAAPTNVDVILQGSTCLLRAIVLGASPGLQAYLNAPNWRVYRDGPMHNDLVTAMEAPKRSSVDSVVISRLLEPESLRNDAGRDQ